MMHIKNTLPDIKSRISSSLQKYTSELNQLGDSMLGNSANIVLQLITEFCNEYRTVLDGNNQELSSIELSGGARISFVFHELYANGVKAVDPFDQVKDIDIRTILYNSSGSSPALFVGTTAFELIVKQQIKRLEDPSLKCVSLVYDELVRILTNILQKPVLRRYPSLKEKFHAVVISFFKKAIDPTNKLVRDLVSMEACYVNTGHPDFLNGHRVREIFHSARNPKPTSPKGTKSRSSDHNFLSFHWDLQYITILTGLTTTHRPWLLSTTGTMLPSQPRSTPKQDDRFRLLYRREQQVPHSICHKMIREGSSAVFSHLKIRRRWLLWTRRRHN